MAYPFNVQVILKKMYAVRTFSYFCIRESAVIFLNPHVRFPVTRCCE